MLDLRLLSQGLDYADFISDDFDGGGVPATGAATIPNTTIFGRANWRCALANGAPSLTYVTTQQDSEHHGILEVNTGTNAAGLAGATRGALGGIAPVVFGSGFNMVQKWAVYTPQASDGGNTFVAEVGYLSGISAPTDGVYVTWGSGNFQAIARKASVNVAATGGTAVAFVPAQWIEVMLTWDGIVERYYVNMNDGNGYVFLGAVAAADVPTVPLGESFRIQKSVGATPRTFLLDRFSQAKSWDVLRGG